jgi:hypothetical protein
MGRGTLFFLCGWLMYIKIVGDAVLNMKVVHNDFQLYGRPHPNTNPKDLLPSYNYIHSDGSCAYNE